jgi:SAM-dependent methyltransferase
VVERKLTLVSAFAAWWRAQREHKSLATTALLAIATSWEFLRESLPDRRRQRYGDVEYDWEHRVDTTSARLSWRLRLLGLLNSPYQPIPADEFREIMSALAIDLSQFTFIDVGSGKGRALLLAAEYPLRRIIGVELIPELDAIARANVQKLNAKGAKVQIELVCGDATKFSFPTEPTIVFLFNPLPEGSLRGLMKNLEESIRRNPRAVYVAYANPVFEQTVARCPLLTRIGGTPQYTLFRSH